MSSYQINAIAARALLDSTFKDAILNGQRHQKLQEFGLTEELVNAIMQIEGNDIHQFIFQLNHLLASQKNPGFHNPWKAMPVQRHCDHA